MLVKTEKFAAQEKSSKNGIWYDVVKCFGCGTYVLYFVAVMAAVCLAQEDEVILRLDFETDNPNLMLHNGAAIVETEDGHALSLNAEQEQYATIEAEADWAALGGVHLEVRLRQEPAAAGQVPIGRPELPYIYLDRRSRPLAAVPLTEPPGKRRYGVGEPLPVGQWHHIVFDYRVGTCATLFADGKLVAMGYAAYPTECRERHRIIPKDTGREWVLGRLEIKEEGQTQCFYMTGLIDDVIVGAPQEHLDMSQIADVKIITPYSWGDIIMRGGCDSKEKIRETLEAAKRPGCLGGPVANRRRAPAGLRRVPSRGSTV